MYNVGVSLPYFQIVIQSWSSVRIVMKRQRVGIVVKRQRVVTYWQSQFIRQREKVSESLGLTKLFLVLHLAPSASVAASGVTKRGGAAAGRNHSHVLVRSEAIHYTRGK
jgi:hypothetical protein